MKKPDTEEAKPKARFPGRALFAVLLLGAAASLSIATSRVEPPEIWEVVPAPGSEQVSLDASFTVRVNDPLDAESVSTDSVILRDPRGREVSGSVELLEGGYAIRFTPDAALDPGSEYWLELDLDLLQSESGESYDPSPVMPDSTWEEREGVIAFRFLTVTPLD